MDLFDRKDLIEWIDGIDLQMDYREWILWKKLEAIKSKRTKWNELDTISLMYNKIDSIDLLE